MDEALSNEALEAVRKAEGLIVTDAEGYKVAADLWKGIRELRVKVAASFKPIIAQAHKAHKTALEKRDEVDGPLLSAERTVKKAMSDYDLEQIRIKREEEKRLAEVARKEEEEKRLKAALEAEKAGKKEEAEKILDSEFKVEAPKVEKATPKVEGGPKFQTRWDFEIVDPDKIPRNFCKPDEVKIRKAVQEYKEKLTIPGVRVFSKRV